MEIVFEKDAASLMKTWHIYLPVEIKEQFMSEISRLADDNKILVITIKSKEEQQKN